MANQIYGTQIAGSHRRRHRKSCDVVYESGLAMSSACTKKKNAEKLNPTTPRRAIQACRLPFSQTVNASQRNVTRLKMESARTIVLNSCVGSRKVKSDMLFFFVKCHAPWSSLFSIMKLTRFL